MRSRQSRARPMQVADRRRAILDVAIPLLVRKGVNATTAEIARAAGIAEGTVFRAFPDKSTLIFGAINATMDPQRLCAQLRAIDPSLANEARLVQAASLLHAYFNQVTAMGELLRSVSGPGGVRKGDIGRVIRQSSAAITAALTELFEHCRAALRVPPSTAVAAFRGLIFASAHPLLPPHERLATEEAVRILLIGIAKKARR